MNIIFPRLVQQEQFDEARLRAMCEQLYIVWQKEHEARNPAPQIQNIRFTHDPQWKSRFLSIQSARDGNHVVWKATKIVCAFAFGVI